MTWDSSRCSPDGAKRNPGPVSRESRISLRFIRATILNPSYALREAIRRPRRHCERSEAIHLAA